MLKGNNFPDEMTTSWVDWIGPIVRIYTAQSTIS